MTIYRVWWDDNRTDTCTRAWVSASDASRAREMFLLDLYERDTEDWRRANWYTRVVRMPNEAPSATEGFERRETVQF